MQHFWKPQAHNMVVKLYEADGVKVFNVTADKVIPSWVSKKRGKKLSKDADYARHIDLIQDFGFPSACHRIKVTQEGHHIFATGAHAPRVRVYDLHNLSMKFERHFDSEVVDFQVCLICTFSMPA
jgi:ribosome biogenesis protein ENP2